MIHWILLHWFITFHNGIIGVQPYCAFDRDTKVWQCNYETQSECAAYNDYCGERAD
jgi:hypothetical protein